MKNLISFIGFTLLVSLSSFAEPSHKGTTEPAKSAPEVADGAIIDLKIPNGAKVFFVNLKNGEKIKKESEITVKFGVKGMDLKPAGDLAANSGHHHLIVDGLPIDKGMSVPFDEHHQHFGKAQTEAKIKLPAGKHTLILQFANGAHLSYGPEMRATVEVIAE